MGRFDSEHVRRRLPLMSLWVRQTLPLALVVFAVIVLIVVALDDILREQEEERLAAQLEAEARLVAELVDFRSLNVFAPGDRVELDAMVSRIAVRLDRRVTVVNGDDDVIADSLSGRDVAERQNSEPEIAAARDLGLGVAKRQSGLPRQEMHYAAVPVPGTPDVLVRVGAPLPGLTATNRRPERLIIAALLAAGVIVVTMGAITAKRVADSLNMVRRQARAMAQGTFEVVEFVEAPRETRELSRSLNVVARRQLRLRDDNDHAQARLDVTLSGLSDGVVITNGRGIVLRLNDAAGKLLGVPGTAGDGQPFVQLVRDYELAMLLRQALTEPNVTRLSATVEHGRSRRILLATAQRIDTAGDRFGIVVLRDETELRRLEQVRREFVANVSHELRTPLTSIKALVETLDAGAVDDPEVAGNFLKRIVSEVDRLAALVDELLDLARLESGRVTLHREPLDVADLIGHGLDRVRAQTERARLSLHLEVAPDLPAVMADRRRVEQVLLNLIHNAIKFTPPEGTIRVSAGRGEDMLRVSVTDTGAGVNPEELPRLFERFYKADKARRSEGTGLGLAIAKHIVQAHGGTIGVESPPGEGATFTFTLPFARCTGEDEGSLVVSRSAAAPRSERHIP